LLVLLLTGLAAPAAAGVIADHDALIGRLMVDRGLSCGRVATIIEHVDPGWRCVLEGSENALRWRPACHEVLELRCEVPGWNDASLSLSDAEVKLVGLAAYNDAGWSVSGAGDIDGDGLDDVVVGTPGYTTDDYASGAAWLVSGATLSATSGAFSLADADAAVLGDTGDERLGQAVAGPGDVDGDGYDDLLLGVQLGDGDGSGSGEVYLFLGPLSGEIALADADIALSGEADDSAGSAVASEDVDGDGQIDLLIGAKNSGDVGAVYVVQGPISAEVALSDAEARLIGGYPEDWAGEALDGAGDIDGDGVGDVIIGAHGEDDGGAYAGAAYLALGPISGDLDLEDIDYKIIGETSNDQAGAAVAGAGDMNGDGLDDVAVGAPFVTVSASDVGALYLLSGATLVDHGGGVFDLSDADSELHGDSDSALGYAVSGAGDTDGDGFDDVVAGAFHDEEVGYWAGAAWLVLGGETIPGVLDVKLLAESRDDYAGSSVSGAGDVDGDGLDDLLIGAYGDDDGGSSAGAAYLFLGR